MLNSIGRRTDALRQQRGTPCIELDASTPASTAETIKIHQKKPRLPDIPIEHTRLCTDASDRLESHAGMYTRVHHCKRLNEACSYARWRQNELRTSSQQVKVQDDARIGQRRSETAEAPGTRKYAYSVENSAKMTVNMARSIRSRVVE